VTNGGPRCERCFGTGPRCVCEQLKPIVTRTAFVVVQHLLEVKKVSNTVRVAALCLRSLEVRVWGEPGITPEAVTADLAGDEVWLLAADGGPAPTTAPSRVVVLDGSWSQVRRMAQRSPVLRGLRRVRLDVEHHERSLRDAPPGGVSTLQALAHTVALLEGEAAARPVFDLHRLLLDRTLAARGYV
jgi:DTW domain-containing protein YfiP